MFTLLTVKWDATNYILNKTIANFPSTMLDDTIFIFDAKSDHEF